MLGRTTRVALGVMLGALGMTGFAGASATAAPPLQFGTCDDAALTQPFAAYGDFADYKLVPGGDFEASAPGWTFTAGAAITDGGNSGQASATLPAGGTVTAPATCVNAAYPTLRFFARGTAAPGSQLRVDLLYRDGPLRLVSVPAGVVTDTGAWAPSRRMATLSIAAGALSGGESALSLRFTAVRGTWSIDDVFVDPYSRG